MTHHELAILCEKSYSPDTAGADLDIGGFGSRCLIFKGDEEDHVVFLGTKDRTGGFQDLLASLVDHPHDSFFGGIHKGILECWEILQDRLVRYPWDKPLVLTGHSLGGALATIAAIVLPDVKEAVTFGCPMVGDRAFCEQYQKLSLKTTRYVYRNDPVPWLPGTRLGYWTVCNTTSIGCEGKPSFWEVFVATMHPKSLIEHMIADHGIKNYVEHIKE